VGFTLVTWERVRKFVVLELLLSINSSFTSYPYPKSNNLKIGAPPFFNGIGTSLLVLIEVVLKGYVGTLPINPNILSNVPLLFL